MLGRRWVVLVLVAAAVAGCSRPAGDRRVRGESPIAWHTDLEHALSRAGAENKLVMVDFYTDWCKWCQVLDEKTFTDVTVQEELGRLIAVKLDAEREGRKAARRYRVDGFPTLLFLDAKGREVGRIPGFLPPEPFLEELGDILKKA